MTCDLFESELVSPIGARVGNVYLYNIQEYLSLPESVAWFFLLPKPGAAGKGLIQYDQVGEVG
jgi:hypothetical protein